MRRVRCVQDIWASLPMISLLMLATDGSLRMHHHDGTIATVDMQKFTNKSSNTITDNRTTGLTTGGPKRWKREVFEDTMGNKEAIDSRYVASDDSTRKIKDLDATESGANLEEYEQRGTDWNERETAEPQFGTSTKLEEFPNISQETKQSWPYWWGGKRQSLYSPNISNIRRPIRVPFNSWGGKRGYAYTMFDSGTQIKRTKQTFDRNDRDASIVGSNEVKRMAEISKIGCRTPFDSWGGKRTEKSVERARALLSSDSTNSFDATKLMNRLFHGGFVNERNMGDIRERQHATRERSDIAGALDSLNGKLNYILRTILPWVCNTTRQDSYWPDEEDSNVNDRIHNYKKEERKPVNNHKRGFDPWGGKRSLGVYTVDFGNDYSPIAVHTMPLDRYKQ